MKQDTIINQKLRETGATDEMIEQYQRYLESGNRQGQERLLCRFRRMQNDRLNQDRDRLACLDYIIAKVERTQAFSAGDEKKPT